MEREEPGKPSGKGPGPGGPVQLPLTTQGVGSAVRPNPGVSPGTAPRPCGTEGTISPSDHHSPHREMETKTASLRCPQGKCVRGSLLHLAQSKHSAGVAPGVIVCSCSQCCVTNSTHLVAKKQPFCHARGFWSQGLRKDTAGRVHLCSVMSGTVPGKAQHLRHLGGWGPALLEAPSLTCPVPGLGGMWQ